MLMDHPNSHISSYLVQEILFQSPSKYQALGARYLRDQNRNQKFLDPLIRKQSFQQVLIGLPN